MKLLENRFGVSSDPVKSFKSWGFPVLREKVYLYVAPWFSGMKGPSGIVSLPAVEKELISLALKSLGRSLLNVDCV